MEYAIIFLPLIGAIVSGFFGRLVGDKFSEIFTSLLVSVSAVLSFIIFYFVVVQGYAKSKIKISSHPLLIFNKLKISRRSVKRKP